MLHWKERKRILLCKVKRKCSFDNLYRPDAIKHETYCGICSSVFYSRHSPFSLTSAPDLMAQIPTVWSLEAVKMADELVAMELMGLLWALISPSWLQFSMFHNLRKPPLQPLNSMLFDGMNFKAQTQSLWAEFIEYLSCCEDRSHFLIHMSRDPLNSVSWLIHSAWIPS